MPVGFLAAITRGQRGEELTEMGELAETGAVAFSDDGMPVASAGLMRRALQYASITDRPLALHCEEPTLSHGGHVHEGRVAAELGFAGYPSVAESVAVERDLALAGYESGRVHVLHLSAAESVDALRRAREAGVAASGEATPHHLVLTDDAVRSLDPNVKMNPPLRAEQDRVALLEAVRDGTIEAIATDHAPHAAHEKEVPFEAAPFGVTGLETAFAVALHAPRRARPAAARDAARAHVGGSRADLRPRPAAGRSGRPGEPRPARPRAGVDGRRAALPLALRQLLAARLDAEGSRADDARRRGGGVRMSYLALADGTVWHGESVGAEGHALGEAVFTTGMSGYQEAVTDPSFEDQLICFTAPMVGNYGVAEERSESARAHARAVLMREARGPEWTDWLRERGIVALTGIDTRSLVLHLRDAGSAPAIAVASDLAVEEAIELAAQQPSMLGRALVEDVSTDEPYVYAEEGRVRIGVVDYGVKNSVLRRLAKAGAAVTVHPHDTDADELAGYDGVLLSPGPGDPEPLAAETETVRQLLGRTHVLGICLGHQLIARATGHDTYKLPFGHRGANHPVHERLTGRVLVTSQNHGFAVSPSEAAEVSHVSLYDGTVEGLDLPRAARPLAPVPSRGGAGPARRLAAARGLGERGGRCLGAPTSSRSASSAPARS